MVTGFRPSICRALESHFQYGRKPARCQPTTVRGVTGRMFGWAFRPRKRDWSVLWLDVIMKRLATSDRCGQQRKSPRQSEHPTQSEAWILAVGGYKPESSLCDLNQSTFFVERCPMNRPLKAIAIKRTAEYMGEHPSSLFLSEQEEEAQGGTETRPWAIFCMSSVRDALALPRGMSRRH